MSAASCPLSAVCSMKVIDVYESKYIDVLETWRVFRLTVTNALRTPL